MWGVCAQRGGGYRDAPGREGAAEDEEKPAWAEDTEDCGAGRAGGGAMAVRAGPEAWRGGRGRRAPARGRIFHLQSPSCVS